MSTPVNELRVMSDELLERGEELGEFMALQLARRSSPGAGAREAELANRLGVRLKEAIGSRLTSWTWNEGLLFEAVIDVGDGPVTEVEALAQRPEASRLKRLVLDALCWDGDEGLTPFFRSLLSGTRLPHLEELVVRRGLDLGNVHIWGPATIGQVEPLYRAYPNLRVLELHGTHHELGHVELPKLERFCASELRPTVVPSLVEAHWPALRELELVFNAGEAEHSEPVFGALLASRMSAALERVVIESPWPEFFRAALPRSPLGRGRVIEVRAR